MQKRNASANHQVGVPAGVRRTSRRSRQTFCPFAQLRGSYTRFRDTTLRHNSQFRATVRRCLGASVGRFMKLRVSMILIPLVVMACSDAADGGSDKNPRRETKNEDAGGREDAAARPSELTIVGGTCDRDGDCAQGRCITGESVTGVRYPGGYCSGSCMRAEDCGDGATCSQTFRSRPGTCYARCENDDGCRDGYRCRVSATSGLGMCMPGLRPLAAGIVGGPCSSDEDCGGAAMSCRRAFSEIEAPGGYCTLACAVHADCGEDGFCVSGAPSANYPVGMCFRTCTSFRACREGYMCQPLSSSSSEEGSGLCVPIVPDADAGT